MLHLQKDRDETTGRACGKDLDGSINETIGRLKRTYQTKQKIFKGPILSVYVCVFWEAAAPHCLASSI